MKKRKRNSAKRRSNKVDINQLVDCKKRFLMSDKITTYIANKKIVTRKRFTGKEWFFENHFPGYPVVPGHLLAEAMVQICRMFFEKPGEEEKDMIYFLGSTKIRFFNIVRPKDILFITVYPSRIFSKANAGIFDSEAHVKKRLVAKATFTVYGKRIKL